MRVLGQASLRARAPVAARLCGGANRYILVPATVYGTATTRCMPTSRRARGAGRHAASVPAQLLARRARALGARAATCGRTCGYVSDTLHCTNARCRHTYTAASSRRCRRSSPRNRHTSAAKVYTCCRRICNETRTLVRRRERTPLAA